MNSKLHTCGIQKLKPLWGHAPQHQSSFFEVLALSFLEMLLGLGKVKYSCSVVSVLSSLTKNSGESFMLADTEIESD